MESYPVVKIKFTYVEHVGTMVRLIRGTETAAILYCHFQYDYCLQSSSHFLFGLYFCFRYATILITVINIMLRVFLF